MRGMKFISLVAILLTVSVLAARSKPRIKPGPPVKHVPITHTASNSG
jgi:hypothetical protein